MSRALARDLRVPLDAYITEDSVAMACLRSIDAPSPATVIEPSVGGGAFVRAARVLWPACKVIGFDLSPDAAGLEECDQAAAIDWLEVSPDGFRDRAPDRSLHLCGNPPFSYAEEHIRHAMTFRPDLVGMLLRLAFLEGQKRQAFWREHPPAQVHVFAKRPSFTGGSTDSTAYAFFVWRAMHVGPPTLGWIR